jgi:hypothetical protein
MATASFQIAATDGIQLVGNDVVADIAGGTLDNSSVVQLNYDDAVFGSSMEGKQRLLAAIELIKNRVASARLWPITAAS